MKPILITGVTGFVGRSLANMLLKRGLKIRGTSRRAPTTSKEYGDIDLVSVSPIGPKTDWSHALKGVEVVVHLAARVHMLKNSAENSAAEYHVINTQATERLARSADVAGVKRFVYISTIKVNGEQTITTPFVETDEPQPKDFYAVSKYEAENVLQQVSRETGLEVVILRPPLVYGPYVKGNFLRLIKLVHSRLPLPFAGASSRRSFISVNNLSDAIACCIFHRKAATEIFLVSDQQALSIEDIVRKIANAFGHHVYLFSVPNRLINTVAKMSGKEELVQRIYGSLQIDSSKLSKLLDWFPPFSIGDEIKNTVCWYKNEINA